MSPISASLRYILVFVQIIQLAAAAMIAAYVVLALYYLVIFRTGGIERARLAVANGSLAALNFEVAATVLKTVALQTWTQFALFLFIFALRFLLKRAFTFEKRSLRAREEVARYS